MYKRILVPLENTPTDAAILEHVRFLAAHCHASVVLIHVADGFVARNFQSLTLRESEEMRADLKYLEGCAASLCESGIDADSLLAGGDPRPRHADRRPATRCDCLVGHHSRPG